MKKLAKIRACAAEARAWTVLATRATGLNPMTLDGACAIGCMRLVTLLNRSGLPARIEHGHNSLACHCWVICGGYVVDVTATQFGGPVLLVSRRRRQRHWCYRARHRFWSRKGFLAFLRREIGPRWNAERFVLEAAA